MKLFESFTKAAPNKVFASILSGALSGISYALLIPLVLSTIDGSQSQLEADISEPYTFLTFEVANHQFAGLFLFTCLFILVTRAFSQITMTRLSMDVTSALRLRLYERISGAPIASLEKLGSSKLIAVLTTDVPRIISGAAMIPLLLVSLVTLFGMLGFLLYLNSQVFWFVLFVIVLGTISYMIPSNMGSKYLYKARDEFDHLQESIRGLIHGAKEL
ncbi:MAG: ABC transporter transmembrane domain-containing protein, partial [Psychrosphaera sp.]|nr:ABC transporter transmembrane domain-containing protein [Psychrosphaera sp.]